MGKFQHCPFSQEHADEVAQDDAEYEAQLAGIISLADASKTYMAIEQLVGHGARADAEIVKTYLRKAALRAHDHCVPDAIEILRVALSATAL